MLSGCFSINTFILLHRIHTNQQTVMRTQKLQLLIIQRIGQNIKVEINVIIRNINLCELSILFCAHALMPASYQARIILKVYSFKGTIPANLDRSSKLLYSKELGWFSQPQTTFFSRPFLKLLRSRNLPWCNVSCNKIFRPDRFSRFCVYWIQTNK